MEECVIGIDVGTTGCKVLALSRELQVIRERSMGYQTSTPRPGWSEQEPEDWWKTLKTVLTELNEELALKRYEVVSMGLTGQMHGLVLLSEDGRVLRPCIMWNDQRNSKQCQDIIRKVGGLDKLVELINNGILPGYTVGKILWVAEQEPEIFKKARKFLNPKDYIRFRLTGDFVTDVSDASGTHMFDVRNRRWCEELLNILDIPINLLPDRVVESSEISGYISKNVLEELKLRGNVSVVGGGGDAVLQLASSGSIDPAKLCILIGTSGVVGLTITEKEYFKNMDGLLQVYCNVIPATWSVFGCMLSAGGSLEWVKNNLSDSEEAVARWLNTSIFNILDRECEASTPSSGGVFFLPFLTGERAPYPDPNARGVFIGLSYKTRKNEIVRSIYEGVTFNLRVIEEILRQNTKTRIKEVYLSGGGAASKIWRRIFSDIFGTKVKVLQYSEKGGSLGAAILAGVGVKFWSSFMEVVKKLKVVYEEEPNEQNRIKYDKYYQVYKNLYSIMKPVFEMIAVLP